MPKPDMDRILQSVREHYGRAAKNAGGCNSNALPSGCCNGDPDSAKAAGRAMGYSAQQLQSVVHGANLGLGCGNPHAYGQMKAGEVVLDLGSGGGFDCFIAAKAIGKSGKVIGVDMTPEMIDLAEQNARKMKTANVEFRLGEIENLPVEDQSVDVIISNCVINLSPDKEAVFREAFRVLKPAGRLAVSDVVASAPLPRHLREDVSKHTGCIAGAQTVETLKSILSAVGFENIRIRLETDSRQLIENWLPGSTVEQYIASARIEAVKPSSLQTQ